MAHKMSQVPTGSTFFVASTIAAAKTVSSVTNATEAVATSTAHGYSNGDIVIMFSGWGRLNKRAFRIKSVTTDTFVLEGCDTSSTTFFPAGSGIGTVQKISTWTQVTTIMNPKTNGGDPKKVTYKFIESDVEYSINDGFAATDYEIELDADSIGGAGYTALKSLTDLQTDTVLRIITKSGSFNLIPCTVALNESVQMQEGQINRVKAVFNGNNRAVRYAS